jgi:tRNA (guanine37-N1)-methyltransferase
MWFGVVTLLPEMLQAITQSGITSRAVQRGQVQVETHNPRDFTNDVHHTVDDRPYGGGPGMVMMVQPLLSAIQKAKTKAPAPNIPVIALTPQGQGLTQKLAQTLATLPGMILVCGRYEGIDERLLEQYVDMEISVGDFIVSGGELPAMLLMDAIIRLLPDVLGHDQSAQQDSFSDGLLDYPHYTRPETIDGHTVPAVLLSGNHREIAKWRRLEALKRTWKRRPDLIDQASLSNEERQFLENLYK